MQRFQRRIALAGLIVLGAASIGIVFAARNLASSQEGTGVVDFANVTPLPFTGYPTDVAEGYPPNEEALPTCQQPKDEQPTPDAPPLSCRSSDSEPPAGAIDTPEPGVTPKTAAALPADWTVVNNRLFRYTVAIPPGWYSNMRPEGGEFVVYDPTAAQEEVKGESLAGGVLMSFTAREQLAPREPDGFLPEAERRLQDPTDSVDGVPAAIWDEGPGAGLASYIHVVFAQDGILYEIQVNIVDDDRTTDAIEADRALVISIVRTISTY